MARCATCLRLHHSDFLLVTPPLLLLLLGQFDNLFAATREELYFALDAIRSQLALVIDLRVTADRLDVHNANVQEARDTNTFADVDTTLRVRTCRFTTRAVCVPHAPPPRVVCVCPLPACKGSGGQRDVAVRASNRLSMYRLSVC